MTDSTVELRPHPARWSQAVLQVIGKFVLDESELRAGDKLSILDPFAGAGGIHILNDVIENVETFGVELEPEWANHHAQTRVGDATHLCRYYGPEAFDVTITSPCYGNRMADHHDASDSSTRHTYKHQLGRDPSDNSSAVMQWGHKYRHFHREVWDQVHDVTKHGGLFILNVSNHIRAGVEQLVAEWHLKTLLDSGWKLETMGRVDTPRMRHGENGEVRVAWEWVYVLRKVR